MSIAITIAVFVIILVALILVHEFGHFITAKKLGMRVDEFGVGFPPKLWGKKRGETEYTINALPFGGFVRIFGQDPNEEALSGPDSARSFVNQPRWAQAIVLVAGVLMNLAFAWVLFSAALVFGVQVPGDYAPVFEDELSRTVIVNSVFEGSPAETAGLKPGDRVTEIAAQDGSSIDQPNADEVQQFIETRGGEALTLHYTRDEEAGEVRVTPQAGLVETEPERFAIGVGMSELGFLALSPPQAVIEGAQLTAVVTKDIIVGIYGLLRDTVAGAADFSQVAGPVGIAAIVSDAREAGFVPLLVFTAFISVNLAIINILPVPALDGGRLFFLGIEALQRKRIPAKVANTANLVGFILLIGLILLVTYNDIVQLAGDSTALF